MLVYVFVQKKSNLQEEDLKGGVLVSYIYIYIYINRITLRNALILRHVAWNSFFFFFFKINQFFKA
jgi:hypothetical protein